jgi:hypothetical protein
LTKINTVRPKPYAAYSYGVVATSEKATGLS